MSNGGVWSKNRLMVDHWAGKFNVCLYQFLYLLTAEFDGVLIVDERII